MAIGIREVANGLAAEKIIQQNAILNHGNFCGANAFVVHVVGADERLALESFHQWR